MNEQRTICEATHKNPNTHHIGPESEFKHGRDFFQNRYVSGCPKCDNQQSPGDASMRAFGGKRPFEFVRDPGEAEPVIAELEQLGRWVRRMEYSRDDAPDEIARAIENRVRQLRKAAAERAEGGR